MKFGNIYDNEISQLNGLFFRDKGRLTMRVAAPCVSPVWRAGACPGRIALRKVHGFQFGFTLIELMVTITVLAILLALSLMYVLSIVLLVGAEVNDVLSRRAGVVAQPQSVTDRAKFLRERVARRSER